MKQLKNSKVAYRVLFLKIFFVFLLLPHLKTDYLNNDPLWDTIFNVGRVISFIIILGYCFFVRKKISKIVIWIVVIKLTVLFITIIKGGEVYLCILDTFSTISVAMICDTGCEKKEIFYSAALFCFEIFIYINLLTEFIYYPEGMYVSQYGLAIQYRNYFLGYYNNHTQYYIPALLVAFLYMYYTGKRLRTYCITFAIGVSAVLIWSGGVVLALFVMMIAYVFSKNRRKLFNYYNYWIIHILFFVFVIVLKIQDLFQWLIDGILGKWGSFIARMALWDGQIKLIAKSLWIGYGRKSVLFREYESGFFWGGHAHNMFLEILYQGGLLHLVLFTILIIVAGKGLYRCHDEKKLRIIETAFCGWCVHCLAEPFWTPFLMSMFVIAYNEGNLPPTDNGKQHREIRLKLR